MSSLLNSSISLHSLSTLKIHTHQISLASPILFKTCSSRNIILSNNNNSYYSSSQNLVVANCANKVSSLTPQNVVVDALKSVDEESQSAGEPLRRDSVPKHVGIILDGSRRWCKARGKPVTYDPLFQANLLFADLCLKWGITTATTFIYSLNNMERGKEANDLIFGQLEKVLHHNMQYFVRKGIRVKVIGLRSALPESLQNKITQVEEATRECTKLELMMAVCYAGTRDIVEATRKISEKVKNGVIELKDIDEGLLESELSTNGSRASQIDLLIRTGGRLRISDFLIWQSAQAELYFTNICSPEFNEPEFVKALRSFQERDRTFGK